MNSSEIHKLCRSVQERFDVGRFVLDGVGVWPAVRFYFYTKVADSRQRRYMYLYQKKSHSSVFAAEQADTEQPGVKSLTREQRDRSEEELSLIRDETVPDVLLFNTQKAPEQSPDFLIFQLFQDYRAEVGGGIYDKYLDPMVSLFGDRYRFQKLCRMTPEAVFKNYTFSPTFYALQESAMITGPVYKDQDAFLKTILDFNDVVLRYDPKLFLDPFFIIERVRKILNRARLLQPLIEHYSPKAVFFQSFPNVEKMPLTLACKRVGVPSIDVQHGYLDSSQIYNDYLELKPDRFDLMPCKIWCWGDLTTETLRAQYPAGSGPDFNVGGYLWDEIYAREFPEVVENKEKGILFIHQPDLVAQHRDGGLLPEHLVEAVKNLPKDVEFMIRMHPRSLHLVDDVEAQLVELGLDAFDVRNASLDDLEIVLARTSKLLTSWSTVAFEANAQGIPVGIIDDVGEDIFKTYVERGWFYPCVDSETLSEFLESESLIVPEIPYFASDPVEKTARLLQNLLKD
ncbi:MAG: hypothetical protein ACPGN3_11855 [Opitutales bacterium]